MQYANTLEDLFKTLANAKLVENDEIPSYPFMEFNMNDVADEFPEDNVRFDGELVSDWRIGFFHSIVAEYAYHRGNLKVPGSQINSLADQFKREYLRWAK